MTTYPTQRAECALAYRFAKSVLGHIFLLVIHLIHLVRVVLIPTKNNLSYFFPSPVLKIELKGILPTSEAVMKIESHYLDQILQRRALLGFLQQTT